VDDWVKLSQRYFHDPRIRGLNGDLADAAEVMFTRGLARAGEVGCAGFIPEQDVELLARRRRYAALVRALTESGLWHAVPGGYQVTRWADWQDHLDALTRKRTADRERQRRRRAAARNGNPLSRDMSRDVTAVEGEGEVEVVKGGSTSRYPARAGPPPRQCPKHLNDTDPPLCGPCKTARLNHERWQTDQATARAERQRTGPRCPTHPTEPADHCRPCRSERLAETEPT
jgi:hypothetical protein